MTGRICLVTGATSGIGRAAAQAIGATGATTVIVGRDPHRTEQTRIEIAKETGNEQVHALLADLSSQQQVRKVADEYRSRFDRLHALVNNAGLIAYERAETEDGHETTFAVNHLAPFLLTNLVLDVLKASAPARVITVASAAHRTGKLDLDDPGMRERWRPQRAYNASKLANVLFTFELARRLEGTGVTANAVHPGAVRTGWGSEAKGVMRWALPIGRRFMRTPEEGAATAVWLATAPEVEGVTGRYFFDGKARRSSKRSRDPELARRLWELSERLTGI